MDTTTSTLGELVDIDDEGVEHHYSPAGTSTACRFCGESTDGEPTHVYVWPAGQQFVRHARCQF